MKQYWVYYRGTGYGMYLIAEGPKAAIVEFARLEGRPVNAYMAWRKV